jgi:glycosyltransferase XagB
VTRKSGQHIRARASGQVRRTHSQIARVDGNLRVNDGAPLPRGRHKRVSGRRLSSWVLIVALVLAVPAAGLVATRSSLFLYLLYVAALLLVGVVATSTLIWMLYAWRTPGSLAESRLEADGREPAYSFSLIVPARHEEAVLETTLSRLISSDHPDFVVLVVVGADDTATREVAERMADRHPGRVRVVVDRSWPKSKPKALNAALPYCSGRITGVFDAEDDVHPALLRRVDQCFQTTGADIVQAGVQLMNFRSSWFTVHNVLEYYFWFRSRLHVHARQRFIPLGGNTVFIRTRILRAAAGWADCLAEDCEIGVRLSTQGARTAVFYEPELVTREECPPTLGAFIRQRTRWNQGYLQTLARGYWRRLPARQRVLGAYILASPYFMALAWLMIPAAIATAVAVKAPIVITLISFLPLLPVLSMLVAEGVGLGEFCRLYGERRPSARDYVRLVLGLLVYQAVLAFAAARALVREARGARGWEKTAHLGLHLGRHSDGKAQPSASAPRIPGPEPAKLALPESLADSHQIVEGQVDALASPARVDAAEDRGAHWYLTAGSAAIARHAGNGYHEARCECFDGLFLDAGATSSWMRLDSVPVPRTAAPDPPRSRRGDAVARTHRLCDAGGDLLRQVGTWRADLVLQLVLLVVAGGVVGNNLLHWPGTQFDEGTYAGYAWAVQHGRLANYTYSYGHPPLAWLLISFWTETGGIFGHAVFSVDHGRQFMLAVSLVSCSLLYLLGRRLGFSRVAAAAAVILFASCPLGVFFHRAVLLDNPSMAFAIAAFLLAWTPQRRLWAFAGSGACFALSVLCKETTFDLLPALVVAVAQNTDRRTRRYCLLLFLAFFALVGGFYPLYATLKGELLPGRGHVSLTGYLVVQLLTRKGTGSIFNPYSQTHAIVASWLQLDLWLLFAALALTPVALARRTTRAVALAFLIQVATLLRPGYLPNMYVIGILPFAALIVPGSIDALWRWAQLMRFPAAVWATRITVAALACASVLFIAPRWASGDRVAMTARQDGPERSAEQWLIDHVGHDKRLIVGDQYWIYLIEHGYNDQPMQGGFFSNTVVSYWPLDYDPAVKKAFPHGWREFDYIVVNQAMLDTLNQTPTSTAAIDHSRVVASFGQGLSNIQIREIVATHR